MATLREVGRALDSGIKELFPGWAHKRETARLGAAQASWLAASYDSAKSTVQRSPRSNLAVSEFGTLNQWDLASIREWSRTTFRSNSIVSGIARRALDNIIGDRLILMPATSDSEFNNEAKLAFEEYTDVGGGWEPTNRFTLGNVQRTGPLSVWRDGDFLMYRSDDGWQFFEGGQIGTLTGYSTGDTRILSGVEIGPHGEPTRYWVSNYTKWGYTTGQAFGLRADRCIHVKTLDFFSGYRGVPLYANNLARLEDFERYMEAELLGAMAAACIMGEINSPHANALDALGIKTPGNTDSTATDPKRRQLAPAMVLQTFAQETFKMHSPNRPSGAFAEYFRGNVRLFGMPLGMPLELTFMDFSQTNFAAAKMAVMQSAKTQAFIRNEIAVRQITRPVYLDFLQNKFRGTKPADWQKFEIVPPENDWIQPEQESNALNIGIEGGWDTRTRIAREEMRRTIDDIMRENADEVKKAVAICKERGLDPEKYWRIVRGELREKTTTTAGANASAANPQPQTSTP